MARVLIVFGTKEGHTEELARDVEDMLHDEGHHVVVVEAGDASEGLVDEASFDGVIVGVSALHGRHEASVWEFVHENLDGLRRMPSAIFSFGGTPSGPGGETLEQFVNAVGWQPHEIATIPRGDQDAQPTDREAATSFVRQWVHRLEAEAGQAPEP